VLDVWKAAAPAVDLLAPDIYDMDDSVRHLKVLDLYSRRTTRSSCRRTAALRPCPATSLPRSLAAHRLVTVRDRQHGPGRQPECRPAGRRSGVGALCRQLPRGGADDARDRPLRLQGWLHAAVEEKDEHRKVLELGRWRAVVTFGPPTFGYGRSPNGNPEPVGALIALGEDEFLVAGHLCRVDFEVKDAASGGQREFLRVEEGRYQDGVFRAERIWNGDETDWALNFGSSGPVLRVQLGTY
jgi:hypothetical protein